MKATQMSTLINNATTRHKLQGKTIEKLFVHNWSYTHNGAYVVLSRVKIIKGLYLRKEISNNLFKYQIPEKLKTILNNLQSKKPTYWTKKLKRNKLYKRIN